MRALVTGVSGFVGRHLAIHLLELGASVDGLSRTSAGPAGVTVHCGDLLDRKFLIGVLDAIRPDHVFHLAGVIRTSELADFYKVNVVGTAFLLKAVSERLSRARVLVSSSSAVYGESGGTPIAEDEPLRPRDDYGASKAAQEMVAISYQNRGANLARVRPFNLVGPGQSAGLVLSEIAQQIVAVEQGRATALHIGNLSTRRDYLDVRDAVESYVAIATNSDLRGVYNVCSGVSRSIEDCLNALLSLSKVPIEVQQDAGRVRSHDVREQVGSYARLKEATGWKPQRSVTDSLSALLEACRREQFRGDSRRKV